MGRGGAHMVRYDVSGGAAVRGWSTFEATTIAGGALPSSTCVGTDWTAGGTNRAMENYVLDPVATSPLSIGYLDPAGNNPVTSEVCFTPRGNAYYRAGTGNPGPAWGVMAGLVQFTVDRVPAGQSAIQRVIFVPPNGVARLVL